MNVGSGLLGRVAIPILVSLVASAAPGCGSVTPASAAPESEADKGDYSAESSVGASSNSSSAGSNVPQTATGTQTDIQGSSFDTSSAGTSTANSSGVLNSTSTGSNASSSSSASSSVVSTSSDASSATNSTDLAAQVALRIERENTRKTIELAKEAVWQAKSEQSLTGADAAYVSNTLSGIEGRFNESPETATLDSIEALHAEVAALREWLEKRRAERLENKRLEAKTGLGAAGIKLEMRRSSLSEKAAEYANSTFNQLSIRVQQANSVAALNAVQLDIQEFAATLEPPLQGKGLVDILLEGRCRTAICFNNGPEQPNWLGIEPLVELPVGRSFSLGNSSLTDYVNNHDVRVDLAAGLRVWLLRDLVSVAVYISKPLTDNKVRVAGSPFIYPGSSVRRPYPGFSIGILYDTLWLGFDRDELRNGNSTDPTSWNRDYPANEVVSSGWTLTLALQPATYFRTAVGVSKDAADAAKKGNK